LEEILSAQDNNEVQINQDGLGYGDEQIYQQKVVNQGRESNAAWLPEGT
jgi:hypothetical protein